MYRDAILRGALLVYRDAIYGDATFNSVFRDTCILGSGEPSGRVSNANAATQNGALAAGTVQVLRGGTLIEVPIDGQPAGGAMPVAPAVPGTGCAPGVAIAPGSQGVQQGGAPF